MDAEEVPVRAVCIFRAVMCAGSWFEVTYRFLPVCGCTTRMVLLMGLPVSPSMVSLCYSGCHFAQQVHERAWLAEDFSARFVLVSTQYALQYSLRQVCAVLSRWLTTPVSGRLLLLQGTSADGTAVTHTGTLAAGWEI